MFVNKDSNNNIICAFNCQQYPSQEHIEDNDPQLVAFLNNKTANSAPLIQAYNAYVLFARSLNLPDKATTADFQNIATTMEAQAMETIQSGDLPNGMAQFAQAVKIPLTALSLINEININGGSWNNITYTENH